MLGFFRKHQKVFFIFVAIFVVISFAFFGTSSVVNQREEKIPDREIGQLVDGSILKERKLYAMMRLLENGIEEGGRSINLLNDSLVHKELILSGLGEILAEHHFEKMAPELEERWKIAKRFCPYTHPYAPHISARNVWGQFSPKTLTLLERLQQAPEAFSKEQLPLLFELYQAQAQFPAPFLHQMLFYQQQKSEKIRPDPGLGQANVALFGFQSVEDWFGKAFAKEVSLFMLNAACIARDEGYVVTKDEAYTDLFSNVYKGLKAYSQENNPSSEDVQKYFSQQLQYVGLDETLAIALWQEVLHCRRLFNEVGEGVLLDRLALDQFKSFAKPAHRVLRYQLPQSLCFDSFREMLKFQHYLEMTSEGNLVELPQSLCFAEDVMDTYPELVYKTFEVELISVTKADVAARIGLKQTWEWEAENFAELQEKFASLKGVKVESVAARMQALDALNDKMRFEIDQYARHAIVDAHPEKVEALLADAPRKTQSLKVGLKGEGNPLSGEDFLALLEVEDSSLSHYTTDGETFYSIQVLNKGKGWHFLSFAEANREGILDQLLDKHLEQAYATFGFKGTFEEVKDEVGAKLYAKLLGKIQKEAQLEDYPTLCFEHYLKQMRELAMTDAEAFSKAQEGMWALEEREEKIALEGDSIAIGKFSPVEQNQFYQLLEKSEIEATASEMAVMKDHLRKDAEQELMRKVLKRL